MRALAQSGLHPSNCRLLDPREAQTSGAGDGSHAVLVLGFESADHPLDAWIARALELCRDAGGVAPEARRATRSDDARGARGRGRRLAQRVPPRARTCATCSCALRR